MTRLRIVVAKPGLDGHDRGAKVVARALRDAGHEVIYTGLRRTPEEIVRIAEDEDASIVGLSSLSGAHAFLFPRVCALLNEAGLGDVVVFGGGIIPQADRPVLHEAGIRGIFGPGTPTEEILSFLDEVVERRANGLPCGVGEGGDWRHS
ncbi:MAG: Methylmalonyl-CoA mutase [Methanobacteriota archaeon]|nr:MAG: Methylmalonyl-CoA mutase [Euryarchaeota archaeon]|tara:strand:- start:172 stop:618 length:447 start_codon:yes stop_codon:yes gene_type:complete